MVAFLTFLETRSWFAQIPHIPKQKDNKILKGNLELEETKRTKFIEPRNHYQG